METLGAIAVVLLVLACPLGMLAIGGAVWLVGRVRGEKKDFSAGCMPMSGHGEKQASQSDDTALREEVSRLQGEVESLKTQANAGRSDP
jgi:50S ribosomal subunit-associated GTPase HflX